MVGVKRDAVLSFLALSKCLWRGDVGMSLKDLLKQLKDSMKWRRLKKAADRIAKDAVKIKLAELLATSTAMSIALAGITLPVVRRLVKFDDYSLYAYITVRNDTYEPDFGIVILKLHPTIRGKKLRVLVIVVSPDVEEMLPELLPEGVQIL